MDSAEESFLLVELSEHSAALLAEQIHRRRWHRAYWTSTAAPVDGGEIVVTDRSGFLTYAFVLGQGSAGYGTLYDGDRTQDRPLAKFDLSTIPPILTVPAPGVLFSSGLYLGTDAATDAVPLIYLQWWEACRCGRDDDHRA